MYASVPSAEQRLRHCWLKPAGCWHLDEMVARIVGETVYLWRAVDHEGEVCQSAWKYWLFSIRRVDVTVARTLSRCRCCAHRDGILPYSHCLPAPLTGC